MPTPTSAERYDASRAAKLAELTRAPGFRRRLALAALPGLALAAVGLVTATPVIAIGAVVAMAGPAAYYLLLRSRAAAFAKQATMTAWASERGLTYVASPPLPTDADNAERARIDKLTLPHMFTYELTALQTGGAALVLDPAA